MIIKYYFDLWNVKVNKALVFHENLKLELKICNRALTLLQRKKVLFLPKNNDLCSESKGSKFVSSS